MKLTVAIEVHPSVVIATIGALMRSATTRSRVSIYNLGMTFCAKWVRGGIVYLGSIANAICLNPGDSTTKKVWDHYQWIHL